MISLVFFLQSRKSNLIFLVTLMSFCSSPVPLNIKVTPKWWASSNILNLLSTRLTQQDIILKFYQGTSVPNNKPTTRTRRKSNPHSKFSVHSCLFIISIHHWGHWCQGDDVPCASESQSEVNIFTSYTFGGSGVGTSKNTLCFVFYFNF